MIETIKKLIDSKNYAAAREELIKLNVVDIATFLSVLSEEELIVMFRLLPKDIASDVFSYFPIELGVSIITLLTDKEAAEIIDDLFSDDAVDFLEEMPAGVVNRLLSYTSAETRKNINNLLNYEESSAGSLMTVEYVSLKRDITAKEALAKIRKEGIDKETINTCYVTDPRRVLLGSIKLRKLLIAGPDDIVGDLMDANPVRVATSTDQEETAILFQKYDLTAVPVVDSENRLVGIITVDDIVDIIQREATEDISKMAAITPDATPYLTTSVLKIWANRVPWLLILMVSATLTSLIIRNYEAVLTTGMFGIILTASIPMLMDTGGNAGSQANVTVIRGLAINELELRDIFKILWKELRASILLGLTLAVVCFGKIMLIDLQSFDGTISQKLLVSTVISTTMLITVIIAKVIGCSIPLLAKKCKLDPAVVASPFITTIVDAIALMVFCAIALMLLPM